MELISISYFYDLVVMRYRCNSYFCWSGCLKPSISSRKIEAFVLKDGATISKKDSRYSMALRETANLA